MTATFDRAAVQALLDASPFSRFAGLDVVSVDEEALCVTLRMPLRDEFRRADDGDMFHGGPVASLIDTAGDCAVALACGGGVPTVNFRTDYLRPCCGEFLLAEASVRRAGRSLAVADINIVDAQQRLCAVGRGTYRTRVG
ncbi:MAG: PaaI family thioesterase [Pseudomonadota bacterium]